MKAHKILGAILMPLLISLHACGGGDGGGSSHPGPSAAAWPMFHLNLQHTGLSPNQIANDTGRLKWSFTTGDMVQSSPAVGPDRTVYVGSNDHKLYAIDRHGKQRWSFTTGAAVKSSPAIANGTIYVGSDDFKFYAISSDGTAQWSFATGSFLAFSSPAVGADGTIYVGSEDHNLYAINPDGTEKWSFTTGGAVESSPALDAARHNLRRLGWWQVVRGQSRRQ